jgi:nitroreductase
MDVTEALFARRSCRAFKPDPVDKGTIITILEAATRAPSWANTQPWEIFVAGGDTLRAINSEFQNNAHNGVPASPDITRPKSWPDAFKSRREELSSGMALAAGEAAKQFGELNSKFFNAPAVLYVCMDKSLTAWSVFDLGALCQSIMLAAAEHGISTMPAVTLASYPEVIRRVLGIPDGLSVVFGIAVGFEDPAHPINKFRSKRRPVAEVTAFKGFD